MRYFLRLAYDGAPFHGWQVQPNAPSVQQALETALATLLRHPVAVTGAGRTDTGVNAREMYAHFDTPLPVADKGRFLLSLNRLLGRSIAIYDLIEVHPHAHARFDAARRTYKYFVAYDKDPFRWRYEWLCPSRLDVERMNEAAHWLLSVTDFTSFAKLHTDVKTNICRVDRADWQWKSDSSQLVFTVAADRFLRNMVRAMVGTLVDVGRGKISLDAFKNIVEAKDRCAAGQSMPAQALFLWKIEYPFLS